MARLNGRLTYANAVATLALFISLGGSGYAAVQLSANSVHSREIADHQVKSADIARNAVTSAAVRDHSLLGKDFRAGQLPTGASGPQGLPGPAGRDGSDGKDGGAGPAGPFSDALPSGKTMRGVFAGQDNDSGATGYSWAAISFPFAMASAPAKNVIEPLGAATPQCPGSVSDPQAAAGQLCVYLQYGGTSPGTHGVFNPTAGMTDDYTSSRWGAVLFTSSASYAHLAGTWAATAP